MKPTPSNPTRGAALVIILCLIVIVLGIASTFLMRVRFERTSAASEASAAITRTLADATVNLVQGQIKDATSLGFNAAWASQPGMIRTFAKGSPGSLAASSNLFRAYKLYSASELISTSYANGADAPPADWATRPALYTDLNAPVASGGKLHYPILDAGAIDHVEGFSVTAAPVQGTSNTIPMPVLWLYMLENGSLVAPTAGSAPGRVAVPGSGTNPIIGRVAFWTDDETSKVNINTASEGTFWDIPRANTEEERTFARYQPFKSEFQRYPGHPAMTSIAPILFATSSTTTPPLSDAQHEAIYALTPRVVGGGSEGGTKLPLGSGGGLADPLSIDGDRLYANVDELIFNASRSDQPALLALNQDAVGRSRFFLTASSRAPEVTLFNTPRVSIWPLDENGGDYLSVVDRLLARAATVNGRRYYFTRRLAMTQLASKQTDTAITRNVQLFKYLQALTSLPVPGFGVSDFVAKYGDDRNQILTEIFDYIRSTNLNDPLVAPNFRFYYRNGLDPGVTAGGQVVPSRFTGVAAAGFGNFPLITEVGIHFICSADGGDGSPGGVLGSNVAENKTLGGTLLKANQRRIEALMRFELFGPGQGYPWFSPRYTMRVRNLNTLGLVQSGTTIPLGFPADATDVPGAISDYMPDGLSAGGVISSRVALAFAGGPTDANTGQTREGSALPARGVMPADVMLPLNPSDANASQRFSQAERDRPYPYVSIPVTVDSAGNAVLTGGSFIVDLLASGETVPNQVVVASYRFAFPNNMPIPVPSLVTTGLPGATSEKVWWTFSNDGVMTGSAIPGRMRYPRLRTGKAPSFEAGTQFRTEDVVRTLVPRGHSDYRLMAKSFIDPVNQPFDDFELLTAGAGANLTHAMVESGRSDGSLDVRLNSKFYGSGVNYAPNSRPDVPTYNANSALGDWDNGAAFSPDGAYINRPDEGNAVNLVSGGTPYFDQPAQYSIAASLFSPNRMLPSAGMFGSLPTGIISGTPFQTLLFRPQPGHPGAAAPADHLLADLFWMPIAEPYAISEPFSTAGKINLNFQIEPFNYIRRATGLVAALRAERLLAIPASSGSTYKDIDKRNEPTNDRFRLSIDATETLKQFDEVFAAGDIFRSPTQICDIRLIPVGETSASVDENFWPTKYKLTGDNSRERPYTNLLGRLTTKSNTFTVHLRAQALKKAPDSPAGEWDETKDKVLGEYRGSVSIERYILPDMPPNDPKAVPNYVTSSVSPTTLAALPPLGNFYRWRTLSSRQFAP